MPDLIVRLTRADASRMIRDLHLGAGHTVNAQHRTGGEDIPARLVLTEDDSTDPQVYLPAVNTTVTVHGLDSQEDLGQRIHACVDVTVTDGDNDPVRIKYGDFELGEVYERQGRTVEEDLHTALYGPDPDYSYQQQQVCDFLEALSSGARDVMSSALRAPVLDPVGHAVREALSSYNDEQDATGQPPRAILRDPATQEVA